MIIFYSHEVQGIKRVKNIAVTNCRVAAEVFGDKIKREAEVSQPDEG